MPIFTANNPLAGGTLDTYEYNKEYPYDLDGGLDYTRPKTGNDIFPYPSMIQYIAGLCPLFTNLEFSLSLGGVPGGTPVDMLNNPGITKIAFPGITGDMQKVNG